MAGSDENNPGVIGPGNFRGTYATSLSLNDSTQSEILEGLHSKTGKITTGIGHSRRALGNIDRNVIGGPYPSAIAKKSLADHRKHAIRAKNPPIPVHRQITSKQQLKLEENIIDEDDDKMTYDFSALMYAQHTEAMLEEIDRMDEVEMEDVGDEPIVDIDSDDKMNALAVVEYVDDLYKFYKKLECCSCVPPDYMDRQPNINDQMRGILIDWLIVVHYKFELMDETLYLMVNDRFLAVRQIGRKKLQLVGVTAMLLACKYEEVSVPIVDDLIIISDKAYSRKEVLDMVQHGKGDG